MLLNREKEKDKEGDGQNTEKKINSRPTDNLTYKIMLTKYKEEKNSAKLVKVRNKLEGKNVIIIESKSNLV